MREKRFDQEGWADVERALRHRAGPEPSADLRNRVLDDVRRALAEPAAVRPSTGAARWAAVAAMLVVGLALSQMAASVTQFFDRPNPRATTASVRAAADLMRQVSPGLTADEAKGLALASASRGDLPAIPIRQNQITAPDTFNSKLNFQGDVR